MNVFIFFFKKVNINELLKKMKMKDFDFYAFNLNKLKF